MKYWDCNETQNFYEFYLKLCLKSFTAKTFQNILKDLFLHKYEKKTNFPQNLKLCQFLEIINYLPDKKAENSMV